MKNESKSESPLIGERSAEEILVKHRPDYDPNYHIEGMCTSLEFRDYRDVLAAMEEYASQQVSEYSQAYQLRQSELVNELYARITELEKAKEDSLPEATELEKVVIKTFFERQEDVPQEIRSVISRRFWDMLDDQKLESKEDNKAFGEQDELWAKVIFEARHYNGTPHNLRALTEHFKKFYRIEKQTI